MLRYLMKVLVLGIDGLDPALVFRMVSEGKLPTIASLIKKGVSGNLRSTIPPYSIVAWTSFMTGREPGGHGVFTNMSFKEKSYEHTINNASTIVTPLFWEFLSNAGKRCLIFSVYNTYPVKPLNGLCIAGYVTPDDSLEYTYPKELKQELIEKFGYRLHSENPKELYAKKQHKEIIAMWCDLINRKVNTFCYYLAKESWDFAVCCLTKSDSVSHHYWKEMSTESPQKNVMEDFYETVDTYVKRLIDAAGKDIEVIIVSDHGFIALDYHVNFNNFLLSKGHLSVRQAPLAARLLNKIGISKKNLHRGMVKLGFEYSLENISPKVKDLFQGNTARNIDFTKTIAFVDANSPEYGLVYINTTEMFNGPVLPDEYPRVVQQLKNDLLALMHNGVKVVENIMTREEIYTGAELSKAPHLLIKLRKGYYSATFGEELFTPATLSTHSGKGIFIAQGEHFSTKNEVEYEIIDIASTVLHLFGMPIPRSFDGKVLIDALKGTPATSPIQYQEDVSIIDDIQL